MYSTMAITYALSHIHSVPLNRSVLFSVWPGLKRRKFCFFNGLIIPGAGKSRISCIFSVRQSWPLTPTSCRNELQQISILYRTTLIKNPVLGLLLLLLLSLLYRFSHLRRLFTVICLKQNRFLGLQGDARLVDITAGGDFLCLCDQKKFI